MKTSLKSLGLILTVLMVGCVPSLHPLFTKSDLIFDEALVGTWKDSDTTWSFKQAGQHGYELLMIDSENKVGNFEAHLVKLGDHHFLDLYPHEPEIAQNGFYKMHLIPSHTFLWIQRTEDTLSLKFMSPDIIRDLVLENPGLIQHEIVKDTVVLTAKPKALQKFLLDHIHDEDLFSEASKLKRQ